MGIGKHFVCHTQFASFCDESEYSEAAEVVLAEWADLEEEERTEDNAVEILVKNAPDTNHGHKLLMTWILTNNRSRNPVTPSVLAVKQTTLCFFQNRFLSKNESTFTLPYTAGCKNFSSGHATSKI